jgi:methyl-accepting chemotaxis protein
MSFSHPQTSDFVLESLDIARPKREQPSRRSRNPLIHVPIAPRLVLGFLIPALIAALAAGIIGIQSAQLLSQESAFYQNLFQSYSSLTTGNDFLQLMDFQAHATITDASSPHTSHDQLTTDRRALQGLATRYDTLLRAYVQNNLLTQHPDQAALFEQAGHTGQAAQQSILASSALRTWNLYRDTQNSVLQDIQQGNNQAAQTSERLQGEPTYFDALSALRQLIQFDGRLTTFVQDATALQERNQLITTLVAIVLVLLAIGVIGRLIYGTLVRRLRQLQHVAQAVQEGQLTSRAVVDGRDEVSDVSVSVNAMLDQILGLLDETRKQRDALMQAATRLFSDIRLANGGDLDVSTAANTDPIGTLGNAIHFTVGRFHRFVLRTKRTIEPLEAISQQEIELINTFLAAVRKLLRESPTLTSSTSLPAVNASHTQENAEGAQQAERVIGGNAAIIAHVNRLRDQVQLVARHTIEQDAFTLQKLVDQATRLCQQMAADTRFSNFGGGMSNTAQIVHTLGVLLQQLEVEAQTIQKNTLNQLAEVDVKLDQLATTARSRDMSRSSLNVTGIQVQEITRLVEGFAQDVIPLAQRLQGITQEMRASLTPFRLEAIEKGRGLTLSH